MRGASMFDRLVGYITPFDYFSCTVCDDSILYVSVFNDSISVRWLGFIYYGFRFEHFGVAMFSLRWFSYHS